MFPIKYNHRLFTQPEILHDPHMWFIPFFFRSMRLSLIVTLYWMPVLLIVNYGAYAIFGLFKDEPIALVMVFFLLVQPYFILQAILAIRGGMMALEVTNGAELNMIPTVTVRVMKFNAPLMWAVTALFGLAGTLGGARLMGTTWIADIGAAFDIGSKADAMRFLGTLGDFPVILFGGWLFGFAVAVGMLGVTTAGAAAMAASRPPNHHNIWGITAEFGNLMTTSLILLAIPYAGILLYTGDMNVSLNDLGSISATVLYVFAGYILWCVCAISAAIALAYSLTLTREAKEYTEMMEAMATGPIGAEQVDLKSLRQSRMKN